MPSTAAIASMFSIDCAVSIWASAHLIVGLAKNTSAVGFERQRDLHTAAACAHPRANSARRQPRSARLDGVYHRHHDAGGAVIECDLNRRTRIPGRAQRNEFVINAVVRIA